jgi:hypothetical protein
MCKKDIGNDAGVIWRLLDKNGAMSVNEIEKYTLMQSPKTYLALGWLARENKLNFFEKDELMYVELNDTSFKFHFG